MSQFLYFYQQQQKNMIQLGTTFAEAYINSLQLMNTYGSIYLRAFEELVQEKDDAFGKNIKGESITTLYKTWLKLTDKELQKQLKSEQFMSLLSKYIDSLVELHSAYRAAGYPINYFDRLLDSYKQTVRIPLSISKDFKLAPNDVVYRKGKVRLLHYHQNIPEGKDNESRYLHHQQLQQPLLIVYAPINQFHILDLNSNESVVRNLLSNGLDVYLLDWGYPGLEDSGLRLSDYIHHIHEAVQVIKKQARTEKVSILGYCWGGMFALIYTAINNDNVRSLTLMATPVDFNKDETVLGAWSKTIDTDSTMDEFGQMDGQVLDIVFLMRNPPRYAFNKYLKLLERIHDKEFVSTFIDTENWLYDTPPVPGNLHRQIINDCYKYNLLASSNMGLDDREGQKIDLQKVTVPLLTIVAERDDIISSKSALAVNDCVSSKDKATLTNPGGHVALCIGNEAHSKLWPEVAKWILSK
jgi:polyhydroxyalkanoate synthase subunit PhaC